MTKPPRRLILLFSGGVDSTLALAWAHRPGVHVHALEFDYPERPAGERRAAKRILANIAPTSHHRVPFPFSLAKPKVTPGYLATRNLAFHAVAQGLAEAFDADAVVAGHRPEDAKGFPDARRPYFARIAALAADGRPDRRRIPILNPLADPRNVKMALAAGAPLGDTWSCWRDGARPCGRCEKCRRRAGLLDRVSPPRASGGRTPTGSRAPKGSPSSRPR